MDAVLVWRWDTVELGRNKLAKELAHDTEAFWADHAAAGRSSRTEWLANPDFSAPQMYMVRGDFQTLAGITMTPEYHAAGRAERGDPHRPAAVLVLPRRLGRHPVGHLVGRRGGDRGSLREGSKRTAARRGCDGPPSVADGMTSLEEGCRTSR